MHISMMEKIRTGRFYFGDVIEPASNAQQGEFGLPIGGKNPYNAYFVFSCFLGYLGTN